MATTAHPDPRMQTERSFDPAQLAVTRIRALRGPNYWRLAPVIACDVRLGDARRRDDEPTSRRSPTGSRAHCRRSPSIRARADSPGGFVERLHEGTHLPHVLEHVALELQTLAGSNVSFGRVVPSGDEDIVWVIVAYEEEDVGVAAMHRAADVDPRVHRRRDRSIATRSSRSCTTCISTCASGPPPARSSRKRAAAAFRCAGSTRGSLVQLGLGRNLRRIQATIIDYTSAIGVEIAQDKDDTKRVLGNIGLPVPSGAVARTIDGAVEIAEEIGYPVILKPLDSNHGRGISAAHRRRGGAARRVAAARAAAASALVVERFVDGTRSSRARRERQGRRGRGARTGARRRRRQAHGRPAHRAQQPRQPARRRTHARADASFPPTKRPSRSSRGNGHALESVPADGRGRVPARDGEPLDRRHVDRSHRRDSSRQRHRVRDGGGRDRSRHRRHRRAHAGHLRSAARARARSSR